MKTSKIIFRPGIGEVILEKRIRSKNIRISVNSRSEVRVSIPWYSSYSSAISFLDTKIEWIKEVVSQQKQKLDLAESAGKVLRLPELDSDLKDLRKRAKLILVNRTEELGAQYGFKFSKVSVRNNSSRWGSCSTAKNISLNLRLIMLPSHLQDFIILHELCHLVHPNHSKDFHCLLNDLCGGFEKKLNAELRSWKLG